MYFLVRCLTKLYLLKYSVYVSFYRIIFLGYIVYSWYIFFFFCENTVEPSALLHSQNY